ncbi:MAG TPA: zinc-binding alcohol dehydrogenase family protein [Tepidisphaeraceae bacterium]|nr:zinc-binding alcohol dehydrogenase family protein [Tepidisphaeraceae bacterium]
MKAWLLDKIGSIDDLRLADDAPDPTPGEGEVVLAVALAGLNPADRYLAEGQYPAKPSFPHILGRDAIGTVVAVGPGVSGVKVGDRRIVLRTDVGVNLPGTLAGRVAVDAASLAPVPEGWSDEQAGGAALVYLTAWQALRMWEDVTPTPGAEPDGDATDRSGDRPVLLVTGASGGVGTACVHLGKGLGFEVVALTRSKEKGDRLLDEGADYVLYATNPDWVKALKAMLGKRRVRLAVDNVGGAAFNQLLETLGDQGRVSCVGRLAGPVPEFNTAALFFRRIRVGGVVVSGYTREEARAAWGEIVGVMGRAGRRPIVDSVWGFEDVQGAFERLAAGPMGKVMIKVG